MTDPSILRTPFPPASVGKLPKISCSDCVAKNCTKHSKSRCNVCGAYISTAHVHLDYVGHAETTDRLLSADPGWTWEPLSFDGGPAVRKSASGKELNLWIKLTVGGVTRIGVGSVALNAFDAEKQLISDAIRNAAMRFGVALDLWAKGELESTLIDAEVGVDTTPAPAPAPTPAPSVFDVVPEGHVEAKTAQRQVYQASSRNADVAAKILADHGVAPDAHWVSQETLDAMLVAANAEGPF